jgi:SAM-dependent methyltransferase
VDVLERLTLERAGERSVLAASHVLRYELAAELCAGLRVADVCCGSGYGSRIIARSATAVTGVDVDPATIETARTTVGEETGVRFECADALDYLARDLGREFDALVILEGLEHLRDPQLALEQLRRHAAGGMRLIVSLPNSRTFAEENPFHVTDYDYESAVADLEKLGDVAFLYQFHAEGTLIQPGFEAELDGRLVLTDRGDREYCNTLIALVNFDWDALSRSAWARAQLAVAPTHNRYMLSLERANRELWRANARLARQKLGRADSAAVAHLMEVERRAALADDLLGSWSWRVTAPLRALARLLRWPWHVFLSLLPRALRERVWRARQGRRGGA